MFQLAGKGQNIYCRVSTLQWQGMCTSMAKYVYINDKVSALKRASKCT